MESLKLRNQEISKWFPVNSMYCEREKIPESLPLVIKILSKERVTWYWYVCYFIQSFKMLNSSPNSSSCLQLGFAWDWEGPREEELSVLKGESSQQTKSRHPLCPCQCVSKSSADIGDLISKIRLVSVHLSAFLLPGCQSTAPPSLVEAAAMASPLGCSHPFLPPVLSRMIFQKHETDRNPPPLTSFNRFPLQFVKNFKS